MAEAMEEVLRLHRALPVQRRLGFFSRGGRVGLSFALVMCLAAVVNGAALSADGKVHALSAKTFGKAVSAHPFLFVEFYAPWCGHCKKLAPIWDETAEAAKDLSVPLAKVDATAEKSLAEEFEVQSFPTLKLFKGDRKVSNSYNGPQEVKDMVAWLGAWQQETLLHTFDKPSAASVRTWAEKQNLALLGVASGDAKRDAGLRQVLEATAFMLNPQKPGSEVPVGEVQATDGSDIAGLLTGSASPPAVVLFRNFDFEERSLMYSPPGGNWKLEPFLEWLNEKKVPALIPASAATEKYFLHNIDPGHGLIISFGGDAAGAKALHRLAVDFGPREKRLKWVQASDDTFAEGLARSVGIEKSNFPELCIWEFGETEDDDKVYRLSQQASDFALPSSDEFEVAVREFVVSWQKGKLKVDKDPVLSITSETFERHVFDSSRDVLVEFFAPWCGQCKSLAPEYKRVALHYASDAGVRIVKMDATKHKHASIKIESYPTLKFYPREKKKAPIDLPFKANRDKQDLVDFVEEHRSGAKSVWQKQAPKKAKQTQPSTKPSSTVDADGGVWVFDDSMQPESRGQVLSADMMASKRGHMLVKVGDIGVLITSGNPAVARAVRRFDSAAAASQHVQGGQGALSDAKPGSLPCAAADGLKACQVWCSRVSPQPSLKLTGVIAGTPCSQNLGQDSPSCNCYDQAKTMMYAMCVSPCSNASVTTAETCAAGDKSCSASAPRASASTLAAGIQDDTPRRKFLLYDTKYGEGFNLQREVYPRAGWVVGELNKAIEARCGSKTSGAECARWTLVLPPWCRVVHWWSGPDLLPWSTFFDARVLRSSKVPIMEFDEYVGIVGGNKVDLAVTYTVDEVGQATTAGKGEFRGWTKELGACATKHRQLPQHEVLDEKKGTAKVVYSGHCDGGVTAAKMQCASFKSPWPRATIDMLSALDRGVDSVLLKHYDYLLAPDNGELDAFGLRESMLFSAEIRTIADNFVTSKLDGGRYISAHCRRTDFLNAHEKTTPGNSAVAAKLNAVLAESGVSKVFVATDAPDELREDLRKSVKGDVFFIDEAGASFEHPGKQAAVEMWIAARAEFFIGTQESRFTSSIQLERGFLGKPKHTSEQEFCKSFDKEKSGKPCINPAHRHVGRKGAHREAYQ